MMPGSAIRIAQPVPVEVKEVITRIVYHTGGGNAIDEREA